MVTACKATVPTITDQASAMQLSQCAKNLASALAELRTAAQKVSTLFTYHKHTTWLSTAHICNMEDICVCLCV